MFSAKTYLLLYLEVDVAVLVGVEGSEDVVAKLLGVAAGEEHLVHVNELDWGQAAVGAVLLEALVPLFDGILVVTSVGLQELEIFLRQTLLALDATHSAFIFCNFAQQNDDHFSLTSRKRDAPQTQCIERRRERSR